MTERQYIEDQTKTCRERWFKDHKATVLLNRPEVIIIEWRNPTSLAYACRFIIHRQWLCVVGDIGEATFQWSQDITIEFLASLEFNYFLSKCRASNSGVKFEQWDAAVAYTNIAATQSIYQANSIDELEYINRNSCRDDYDRAARACYDRTGDAESASSIASAGIAPSVHAIGMFVGLQMAIAQLKKP